MKRIRTDYPGVFYREATRIGGPGIEKIYYIVFKKDGRICEEKAGRQYADDMTPAKASRIRADRIEGRKQSRKEIREKKRTTKEKWTLSKLWEEYKDQKPHDTKNIKNDKRNYSYTLRVDEFRFNKHLKSMCGDKAPSELYQLDVDRLRINLLKVLSPQTVKHVLSLLKRLSNFGVKKQLCQGINFKIEMPRVYNLKTEDLTSKQLKKLIEAMDKSEDTIASDFMRLALFTGMRRGEIMKLRWTDINFDRGFIEIKNPKGGPSQKIPLNNPARAVMKKQSRRSEYVFVRENGLPFTNVINKRVRVIRDEAGLSSDFRPLHGLRHFYASMLASSGQVDMYTLQKLLTHKSPLMTQRYAHLRDEALKKASTLAGNMIEQVTRKNDQESEMVG
jgi:integrase